MASLAEILAGNYQPQFPQSPRLSDLLMRESVIPLPQRETPSDVLSNPTPFGLFDLIGSAYRGARAPGDALGGAFDYNRITEGDVDAGTTPQGRLNSAAGDMATLLMGGGMPFSQGGALGMAGGKIKGNRQGMAGATEGAQPLPAASSGEIGRGAPAGFTQSSSNDRLAQLLNRIDDEVGGLQSLMEARGYKLANTYQSPRSEARYLTFQTDMPPIMSKRGISQLFQEMRDMGLSLGNNPTGNSFVVRLGDHQSGAGSYPAPSYEWRLHRDAADNISRLSSLLDAMQRIARERPPGR